MFENASHFLSFHISRVTGWRLQLSTHEMIPFVGTFSMQKAHDSDKFHVTAKKSKPRRSVLIAIFLSKWSFLSPIARLETELSLNCWAIVDLPEQTLNYASVATFFTAETPFEIIFPSHMKASVSLLTPAGRFVFFLQFPIH